MPRNLNYDRVYWNTQKFRDRMYALDCRYFEQAQTLARQGKLCPDYPFLHAHNAMVAEHYGNPWPETDYRIVQRILDIEKKRHHLVQLYYRYSEKQWQSCFELAHFG